jgi:parvulin-like peptidyl-prolyl isomerase
LILILSLFLLVLNPVYSEIINGIACKVGSSIITIHDFETAYEQERLRSVITGTPVPDKKSVMNVLIDNLLVIMESEKKSIVVTEEELDDIVENIIVQNNLTREEFVEELEKENLSLEVLRENYRNDVLRMRLASQITSQRVNITTEEEIKNFYEVPENKKLFIIPGIVELSRVFIPVPEDVSYKEAKEIKNHAAAIYEQASQGADFREMISTYSNTPESAGKGGFQGSFTKEQLSAILSPEGANLIFSLDTGDVAAPMMIMDGYYIYKIDNKQREKILSYEEAYESINSYLMKEKGEKIFREWLIEKRKIVSIHYMIEME